MRNKEAADIQNSPVEVSDQIFDKNASHQMAKF